jgi:hypothetical protein
MIKKSARYLVSSSLVLLTGCASYQAVSLNTLPQDTTTQLAQKSGVSVSSKVFDEADCKRYLDRNVIKEGYLPVQITIRNDSKHPMYFNPNNLNVTSESAREVARTVHTSTGGRIAVWGIGGLIFFPLLIPAVVDGFKSSEANKALDEDYISKSVKEHVIEPYSNFTGLIFVSKDHDYRSLEVSLVDQVTKEKLTFSKIAN